MFSQGTLLEDAECVELWYSAIGREMMISKRSIVANYKRCENESFSGYSHRDKSLPVVPHVY
jgi:hypothetical protein